MKDLNNVLNTIIILNFTIFKHFKLTLKPLSSTGSACTFLVKDHLICAYQDKDSKCSTNPKVDHVYFILYKYSRTLKS